MEREQLDEVLARHAKWWRKEDGGERASLNRASLNGAYLNRAYLDGAYLDGAYLNRAYLDGASLVGAYLNRAYLDGAYLDGASLVGASLVGASLVGASLVGAIMPDGRTWEAYKLDPLAGICDEPEARKRAIAAWGSHTWGACPMHMAHGWNSISDAPGDKRIAVAAFVALFDSRLLPEPEAFEARK